MRYEDADFKEYLQKQGSNSAREILQTQQDLESLVGKFTAHTEPALRETIRRNTDREALQREEETFFRELRPKLDMVEEFIASCEIYMSAEDEEKLKSIYSHLGDMIVNFGHMETFAAEDFKNKCRFLQAAIHSLQEREKVKAAELAAKQAIKKAEDEEWNRQGQNLMDRMQKAIDEQKRG